MTPDLPPMLATAGPLPTGPGWAFEFKYDGVRALTHVDGELRVLSRNGNDITGTYPELAEVRELLGGRDALLDGEIVALAEGDRPSFARLQSRMHVVAPTAALLASVPIRYYVFDLLWLAGESLVDQPYARRRELLRGLGLTGGHVRVPTAFTEAHGSAVLHTAELAGFEGVVAKRLTAPYRPGRRSADWTKVPLIRTQEVLIIGWEPGAGRRSGTVGALLLGVQDSQGRISYAGQVGTGFTDAMLRHLHEELAARPRAEPAAEGVPREHARKAHWVEPDLVGEVAYRTWTSDGRLRHASWRGLRPDQPPAAAKRDIFQPASVAEPQVAYAMVSQSGHVRVEIIRRAGAESFRVLHGDSVLEGLDIDDVEALMAQLGIGMDALEPVDPATRDEAPEGAERLPA